MDGAWGTVCDDLWDIADARVVCQQLGYGEPLSAPHGAAFGSGSISILMDNVECSGTERRLQDCDRAIDNDCNHSEDAGVVCSDPDQSEGRQDSFN